MAFIDTTESDKSSKKTVHPEKIQRNRDKWPEKINVPIFQMALNNVAKYFADHPIQLSGNLTLLIHTSFNKHYQPVYAGMCCNTSADHMDIIASLVRVGIGFPQSHTTSAEFYFQGLDPKIILVSETGDLVLTVTQFF